MPSKGALRVVSARRSAASFCRASHPRTIASCASMSSGRAPSLACFRSCSAALTLSSAVSARSLHDPPAAYLLDPFCTESFESHDFGLDIVGFDIDMDPARVIDALQFDMGLVRCGCEQYVIPVVRIIGITRRVAEGLGPEFGGCVEVVGTTVDDQSAEPALVHIRCFLLSARAP